MNKEDSLRLALKVQRWYHSRGYKKVRAWVEKEESDTSNYLIKSNIKFVFDNDLDSMLE